MGLRCFHQAPPEASRVRYRIGRGSVTGIQSGGATPAFAAAEGFVPISQERQCGETMRKAAGYVAILMSIAVLFLATSGATTAYAGGGNGGSPPGNNGVVKVISDPGDSQNDPDNDPHVCLFHLYGFNFDANSSGTWHIDP